MKKINYENIIDNINYLKNEFNKPFFFVVKNNAYNTDLIKTCHTCLMNGQNYFAVCTLKEAVTIKQISSKAYVLIMNPLNEEEIKEAEKYDLALSITSLEWFIRYKDLLKKVRLHLKVNSGMNRFGLTNIDDINMLINQNSNIEGLFTHFGCVEENNLKSHNKQVDSFVDVYSAITNKEQLKYIHSENSGTLLLKDERLNFCNYARIGILVYGYSPTTFDDNLKSAIYLTSEIVKVHEVAANEYIGYGMSNSQLEDSFIAICPLGYGDGLSKQRSCLPVIINNKEYPIIAISMSHTIIKVDESVVVGEKVEFYGDKIKIDHLLQVCDTTNSIHMAILH